jgi:hypothetical protein
MRDVGAGDQQAAPQVLAGRRGVTIRILRERGAEVLGLYAGMNTALDEVCAGYRDDELAVLAGFLRRTAAAGQQAAGDLAAD